MMKPLLDSLLKRDWHLLQEEMLDLLDSNEDKDSVGEGGVSPAA